MNWIVGLISCVFYKLFADEANHTIVIAFTVLTIHTVKALGACFVQMTPGYRTVRKSMSNSRFLSTIANKLLYCDCTIVRLNFVGGLKYFDQIHVVLPRYIH